MHPHSKALALLSPLLFLTTGTPADSQEARYFKEPYRLKAGSEFVEVSVGYACPTLFDIDQNGTDDLVVGEYDQGQVRLFFNQGIDGEPVLAPYEYLMIGSERFSVPIW